jgi:signal transduction histidine kinase
MDHGGEALIGLVGAHGDAFELLEPAEEALDETPPFVHLLVDSERLCASRMLGDDDLGAARVESAIMALLSNALSAIRPGFW